jgi:uncharacterized protein
MLAKLAVVTGASSGIGLELARQLASRGYDLLLVARREERLRDLADRIRSETGRDARVLSADLVHRDGRDRLLAALEDSRDALHLVVNNAGFGYVGPAVRAVPDSMANMIELNITALTELSLASAKILTRRREGGLINVASTASFQPVPYMNVYSATKAYVLSFTEALAEELREYNVRVMALCPGNTKTEFQAVAGVKREDRRARPVMSAEECVRIGLDDFERGKRVSVTGIANKLMVFGSWAAPRGLVIRSAARLMKNRGGETP